MIKNIMFDFGDVFLNIDEPIRNNRFEKLGIDDFLAEMDHTNKEYEKGNMTTAALLAKYKKKLPDISEEEIKRTWNSMLHDLPEPRLQFLKKLAAENKYNLIFLSNTNDLHIEWVKQNIPFFEEFKNCFDAFYLSYEMGMRKPDPEIFEQVLKLQDIKPEETVFIDDNTKNTDGAASLGIHVWNLKPGKEDVTQLFEVKKELF